MTLATEKTANVDKIPVVNLWFRVKAQCLGENPYIWKDEESGQEMVQCPRCGSVRSAREYITLSIQPAAMEWSCPIRKCPENGCHHLFAYVQ